MNSQTISRDSIINFLQENKTFLEEAFGVTKIALFGSYARSEQTPNSDVDLAIETKSPSFEIRCLLKDYLEENLGKRVDLCYFQGMRRVIRILIEKDLIYV